MGKKPLKTVRVFDLKNKRVFNMPEVELAPGMVPAKVHGVEGTVWIDSTLIKGAAEWRNEPLTKELREQVRTIKAALDDVRPQTLEQWEEGLQQEGNPAKQIAIWLRIAKIYQAATARADWTADQKKDILRVLLMCTMGGKDQILLTLKLHALSRQQAAEIADMYFTEPR